MARIIWCRVIPCTLLLFIPCFAGLGFGASPVWHFLFYFVNIAIILCSIPAPCVTPQTKHPSESSYLSPEDEALILKEGRELTCHKFIGTHNSTHVASLLAYFFVPQWRYTHRPLVEQLQSGIRHLELDIWYSITNKEWQLRHENVFDCLITDGTQTSLKETLNMIAEWSKSCSHKHVPLIFNIDVKGAYRDGFGWAAPVLGRGLNGRCGYEKEAYGTLKEIIRAAFDDTFIFTPLFLKRAAPDTPTLRDAVVTSGWGSIESMACKSLFFLNLYHGIGGSFWDADHDFFFVRGDDVTRKEKAQSDSVYFEVNCCQNRPVNFVTRSLDSTTDHANLVALDTFDGVTKTVELLPELA